MYFYRHLELAFHKSFAFKAPISLAIAHVIHGKKQYWNSFRIPSTLLHYSRQENIFGLFVCCVNNSENLNFVKMFTQNMANISRWIFTIGSTVGFSPYKVDRQVGKLYVDRWSFARSLWNWTWLVAYAYVVLPTHLYDLYFTNQFHKFNYTVIIMLCCSMGIVLVGALLMMSHGTCQFLNALFKFIQDFPGYISTTFQQVLYYYY